MAKKDKIQNWVEYIQRIHAREIDMSLERVRTVFERMHPFGVTSKIISIAGTNGKGSVAEMISSILRSAGYRVGKYTSPHLIRFNERFLINGMEVSDSQLLRSFSHVEVARNQLPLTFFEFGTLVAIDLFVHAEVDYMVMEVGLGGRLDAVNILDADVSIFTSLSVDHTEWLGQSREQIGMEKIGIARAATPCVFGFGDVPLNLLEYCEKRDIQAVIQGQDFAFDAPAKGSTWTWRSQTEQLSDIPLPFGQRGCQLNNAASAIMASRLLPESPIDQHSVRRGIGLAKANGRCEMISQVPYIILDVAHNSDSVKQLAESLESWHFKGRIIALCGMLADKQTTESLAHMLPLVDEWHFVTVSNARAATALELTQDLHAAERSARRVQPHSPPLCHDDTLQAYNEIKERLEPEDCLVVFGSFHLVGDILPAT
ncbi:MAG: bifunctional folylpolyglutamate synthase/dihydrofolate synthase [Gammaproteobacteria bacterium]|nr:bifunctional folylpolyglutamate synthase/dihydrofolate synthase [Gammaproteobacteria bacterium]